MKMPLMTELFVLREANVTTLAQMNKVPLEFAEHVNSIDRKNADSLLKIFVHRYRESVENDINKWAQSDPVMVWDGYFRSFMNFVGGTISKFLSKNPSKKNEMTNQALKDWRGFLEMIKEWRDSTAANDLSNKAVMKFPDGFYWTKISDDDCEREGSVMQHCGVAVGDMYSLRDKEHGSHVTIDVLDPKVDHSKWISILNRAGVDPGSLHDQKLAIQIRGKQNTIPNAKYWKHIRDFFDKEKIVNLDMEHHDKDEKLADEFNDFLEPPSEGEK